MRAAGGLGQSALMWPISRQLKHCLLSVVRGSGQAEAGHMSDGHVSAHVQGHTSPHSSLTLMASTPAEEAQALVGAAVLSLPVKTVSKSRPAQKTVSIVTKWPI